METELLSTFVLSFLVPPPTHSLSLLNGHLWPIALSGMSGTQTSSNTEVEDVGRLLLQTSGQKSLKAQSESRRKCG